MASSYVSQALMPDAARVFARLRSMTKTLAHYGIDDYRRRNKRLKAVLADSVQAEGVRGARAARGARAPLRRNPPSAPMVGYGGHAPRSNETLGPANPPYGPE